MNERIEAHQRDPNEGQVSLLIAGRLIDLGPADLRGTYGGVSLVDILLEEQAAIVADLAELTREAPAGDEVPESVDEATQERVRSLVRNLDAIGDLLRRSAE